MKLIVPEVDCSNGFSGEIDIFNRKKLSEQLESIIKNSDDDSLVLAINDEWGSGKSTFLKMWESQVNSYDDNELKFIYFDAFKNDHQDDAFIALSSAIYPVIEDKEKKRNYVAATKKAGAVLVKTTAKIAIKAITLGVLNGTELEEGGDDIADALNEPIEKIIQEKLEKSLNESAVIEHFKTSITEAAGESKIIFVIDELDRARPDFSLDLLEKIKHVFDTKKIFFVLAVNKDQFVHAIKKRYGDIDADTYLSKFIHFWFSLPNVYTEHYKTDNIPTYFKHIIRKNPLQNTYNDSIELLSEILQLHKCSLRDAERCYSTLSIVAASGGSPVIVYQVATAILVFLKIKNPRMFEAIKSDTVDYLDVGEYLNYRNIKTVDNHLITRILISDMGNKKQTDEFLKINGKLLERNGNRTRVLKEMMEYFDNLII